MLVVPSRAPWASVTDGGPVRCRIAGMATRGAAGAFARVAEAGRSRRRDVRGLADVQGVLPNAAPATEDRPRVRSGREP